MSFRFPVHSEELASLCTSGPGCRRQDFGSAMESTAPTVVRPPPREQAFADRKGRVSLDDGVFLTLHFNSAGLTSPPAIRSYHMCFHSASERAGLQGT
jgi:hypothetical protein